MLEVESDSVEIKGTPTDPLDKFTPLKTLMGFKMVMDFTMPPGKVLQRYAKK